MLFSDTGSTYFLGNSAAYPSCFYSTLKFREILGVPAQAWMLERFGHAGLFALNGQDTVNAFCAFDPLGLGERLARSPGRKGFRASVIAPLRVGLSKHAKHP